MYLPPVATSRLLVRFVPEASPSDMSAVVSGVPVNASFAIGADEPAMPPVIIEEFGVFVMEGGPAQMSALQQEESVLSVRPEFYLFATDATESLTWGVRAVGAGATGAGIKVAVLDTGFDLKHPDFFAHKMVMSNFTTDASVQDGNGHGTHVAGTIAGPIHPSYGPRYGIAPDVDLYIGKVLSDRGVGREFDVISGIAWAIKEGCQIASLSLGRSVRLGEAHDPMYEKIGKVALDAGCLVIAAAGNDSDRTYGYTAPVGSPANSPSFMAVGSVDRSMWVSSFSCGGTDVGGGEVDIMGPGENVHSSWPMPRQLRSISGTSMATPHVAGIAALLAQLDETLRGQMLWNALTERSRRLGDARDYGAGIVRM